jgi:eukaryotic-like serine/threonine-protein kinase
MVGKLVAHYVVLEQAGAGGMGVVYRARDEKLQRDVALKVPPEGKALTDALRAKWLAEARAASTLNHPNICTIYEVGECEGQPYIAMEYLAGATLNERIPDEGLPAETVLEFGAMVASALEHAHSHGVLHRDLKSANVRLTGSGQLKVLDFGLAISFRETELEGDTKSDVTDSAGVSGTLAYLAPEVLSGENVDVRSDIWALGVLLYEMASGTHPFRGRTSFELSSMIMREAPRALPVHVPPGLRAIILHCLAKQPEQRYQRASEVKAALEALHSNGGAVAAAAAGPLGGMAPRTGRINKRHLWLAGGMLAAAAAVVYFAPWARPRVAATGPGEKLRLLLSTETDIAGPAISPDGKMLAYVERGENSDDLYVSRVAAAGGERVKLTKDISRKGEPAFSPDGEKIAFARKVAGEPANEVCTIAAFGGEIVAVARGGSMPTWAPEGSRLAFVLRKEGEPEELAISTVDGRETRTILAGDAIYPFLGRPAWSPDGKWIAVARSRGGDSREIWMVPVSGKNATQLTHGSAGVASDTPVFSADGRGVVYRSNQGGAWNLWYQDLNGSGARQLTTGPGPDSWPSVARDGTIAFLNSRRRAVLVLYELATGQSKPILSDTAIFWAPAFSPDGAEVTYTRGEPDGSWHLWSVGRAGGTARQLTFGKVPEVYARYAPDGGEVYYSTWGPEPLSIWHVGRNGGLTRPLDAKGATSDSYADISPDGKWAAFARTENRVAHVYVRPADGTGEARKVVASPGTVPRWSPDGKWIAFSPDRGFGGGAFVVHPDGSGMRRVAERGGWPVWWPDGEKIGLQTVGPEGSTEITVVTVATGETRVLPGLRFSGVNYPFDVSRDGKWLVTTNSEHEMDEIWLLEGEKR